MTPLESFLITLSLILSISLILISIYFSFSFNKLKNYYNEMTNQFYKILENINRIDGNTVKLKDNQSILSDNMTTLSNRIETHTKTLISVANEQRLPTPQQAMMITDTIKEQIQIQVLLSRKQRIPSNNMLIEIVTNVCNTYPNIDVGYISEKTIALIESMTNK